MTVKEFVGAQSESTIAENRMTFEVITKDSRYDVLTVENYETFAELPIIAWKADVRYSRIILLVG